MPAKYILNPDGTVNKYEGDESNELGTLSTENAIDKSNIANLYRDVIPYAAKEIDGFGVDQINSKLLPATSLISDWPTDDPEQIEFEENLFINTSRNESFDTERETLSAEELKKLKSYKPFNSFTNNIKNPTSEETNPSVFADEFEMLTGMRLRENETEVGEILASLFTYFAQSAIRLVIIEAIILINRALSFPTGDQYRTAERYVLRIGKYDYTEFDVFTKYIYDVLNYPHESSTILERISAYFIGFAEWMAPDSIVNLKEIVREFTTDSNDLDFLSSLFTEGDNREIFGGLNDTGTALVYSAATIAIASSTNQTVNKRAKLLFRKFFQEKYWKDNLLHSAKQKESLFDNIFADLNYYYFKFYIERVQVGLKIIKKYIYDDSYLPGRPKDSSFNRVSGQRSNRHIDYNIQINDFGNGKFATGELGITEQLGKIKALQKQKAGVAAAYETTKGAGTPDDELKKKAEALQRQIDAINQSLPDFAKLKDAEIPQFTLKYDWQNKHSDGNYDHPTTHNKVPGQTTRLRALPQLFTLHESLYKALLANSKKGVALEKSLMQNFYGGVGKKIGHKDRRIPSFVVAELENILEAEYMPFYFHDVRTNELLSFHAFIESITDSFNPEYNSASGFGRIDDVRSYIKTTRNLNLSFTIAATSETDHDLMWYQVNKLVAMVYPQWSDGYSAKQTETKNGTPTTVAGTDFKFPFTQVPTASPLIRLRVGDVIKSNYSRTNLSRLHGVGERDDDIDFGANIGNKKLELMPGLYRLEGMGSLGVELNHGPRSIKIDSPVPIVENEVSLKIFSTDNTDTSGDFYQVTIENPYFKEFDPAELLQTPPAVPKEKTINVVADASKILVNDLKTLPVSGNNERITSASAIMKSFETDGKSNNPITGSYESGMSRGLAGFITQLDVNYNEVNWETSRIGSKAPMLVKITINFAPIHDIPPGLDHNGMLRAPVYNVGRINNEFFGDSQDREYSGSGRDRALAKYKLLRNKNSLKHSGKVD